MEHSTMLRILIEVGANNDVFFLNDWMQIHAPVWNKQEWKATQHIVGNVKKLSMHLINSTLILMRVGSADKQQN